MVEGPKPEGKHEKFMDGSATWSSANVTTVHPTWRCTG